ncbi:hypothetical protein B1J92_I10582g [Nakaseomyces glabratus]|nr:hypothetical protein B1J91_I10582g [Nakaseomyces glabratus]OXB47945.1 hypothetical protein B1J92_I10582g [Nakaseomyces glabratus]
MCILFATREHPDYELIMISNRDEFLERKTHSTCWHNDDFILSPYDLARIGAGQSNDTFGTWTGVNRKGRVATVLNLRICDELDMKRMIGERSRGALPFVFLNDRQGNFEDWDTYAKFCRCYPDIKRTGDFNLFYGDFKEGRYALIDSLGNTHPLFSKPGKGYLVISNDIHDKLHLQSQDINSGPEEWGKIKKGKQIMEEFVKTNTNLGKEDVIENCFKLASTNLILDKITEEFDLVKSLGVTKETIYVQPLLTPPHEEIGSPLTAGQYYGTRSQIVLLVDKSKTKATFIERIIYSSDQDISLYSTSNPKEELRYEYDIE